MLSLKLFNRGIVLLTLILLTSIGLSAQQSSDNQYKHNWTAQPFDYKLFIENKGQCDKDIPGTNKILFQARIGRLDAYFTTQGMTYRYKDWGSPKKDQQKEKEERKRHEEGDKDKEEASPTKYLSLMWIGSNPDATIEGGAKEEYYNTYPDGMTGTIIARVYRHLTYRNLYPGIDVEYLFPSDTTGIKFNIIVHPHADLSKVRLKYQGAKDIRINATGDVVFGSELDEFTDHAPVAYYQDGGEVKSSYIIDHDVVSFTTKGKYNSSKTLVIDPWTTNPLLTGGYNSAYEVDYDFQGNVYTFGAWGPAQLVKFNSAGVIQWRFSATTLNLDASAQWGDLAVDRYSGSCYLAEGYNTPGAKALKVGTGGTLIATFPGNTRLQEFDRMTFNHCTGALIIAGGGPDYTNQAAILDTNMTTAPPLNVLGANLPYHDMWLLAIDPAGTSCYMGSVNSCCNNNAAYDDRLLNLTLPALGAGTFNVNINALTSMPEALSDLIYMTWSGVPANGFNGLACTPNWLFLYDGADLFKFNKTNGSLIVRRSAVGSTQQSWGGLDADLCNNVYVGHNSTIAVFNGTTLASGSAPTSTIALSNTVYDLMLGKNYTNIYASGEGYVSSFSLTSPPVSISKVIVAPTCANPCSGSITANLNMCGTIDTTGATYQWSNGATTHTITGLCAGTYTVTITPNGVCMIFTDTVTIGAGGQYAGPDQTVSCTALPGGTATMAATGSGTWTAQAGNPGTATITTPSSPTTTITTFSVAGTYNFIWSASGCSDTAAVIVNSAPNAGVDQFVICYPTNNTATMAATGSGTWTAQAGNPGTATITTTNSPTTTITGFSAAGTYHFIWTNGSCSDTAAVTVTAKPNAGTDQYVNCYPTNNTATMAGTGTGLWIAQTGNPGTATITSPTSTTTTITGFSAVGTYNFILTSGSCTDTASVIVSGSPNAGSDQTLTCVTLPGGSALMNATGTGTWSAWSGNPGTATITSASSPTTTITGFSAAGTYDFLWTNGGCSDTAAVIVTAKPNAGVDQLVSCYPVNNAATMAGTGSGTWTAQTGNPGAATIITPGSPTTTITSFSAVGTYYFIWTNGACSDTAAVTVTGNANAGPDQYVSCYPTNNTATMAATGSGTWTAQAGNPGTANITTPSSPTTTITAFSTVGTYNFIWTNGGCSDTAAVIVSANPDAGPDTITCLNSSADLHALGTGIWTAAPNNPAPTVITSAGSGNTSVTGFSLTGNYSFIWTSGGCADTAIVNVMPTSTPPVITASGPISFCSGDSVVLTSSAATGNLWSDHETTQSITVYAQGTYTVSDTLSTCPSISTPVTVSIIPTPQPVIIASSPTICPDSTVVLDATTASASAYLWSTAATQPSITVLSAGTYQVTVTVNGCPGTGSITIAPEPALGVISLPDSSVICPGDTVTLNATTLNATSYIWTGQITATTPAVVVDSQGVYTVHVSNSCGTASASTIVAYLNCDCGIVMPDAFSPNGDNANETYHPVFNCDLPKSLLMRIYNRWGQKVFETNDLQGQWDGRYKGDMQPSEVYMYYVEFTGVQNNTEKTVKLMGSLTLIR